ncbi:MAG TPA: 3,4-dihydroxy-2-butanone-4-phosphate synthase [Burkholderiaceae bacterium]|nr:3,4-dihydroxy-2-butanone-4-phosphate synthase [Burkholderiaceae bacterium]
MSTNRERTGRVQAGIEDIRAGKMVILVDDEDRENEGDLTMAAEKVTPEALNFMAKWGRGLICLTLTEEKADALELPLQAARKSGGSPFGTAFTVTIEARHGVTTGISAKDRATTILTAVHENARAEDLITPGHVFPLRAKRGGVLQRTGQTEGSVDLARLAGLNASGVICEIMNDDGSMARMPDLEKFAQEHGLAILSIADLIEYRLERESLVKAQAEATIIPSFMGTGQAWRAVVYSTPVEQIEYLAMTLGDVSGDAPILVRVQTACFPGDVFGSEACDCGPQLRAAIAAIEREGRGVFLYVHPAGRHSLLGDIKAHVLHEEGPRVAGGEHKLRDFGLGAQVLSDLGVKNLRLLTNNPKKIVGLEGYGMCVVDRVPIEAGATQHNITYLRDKRDREGHLLATPALAPKPKKE